MTENDKIRVCIKINSKLDQIINCLESGESVTLDGTATEFFRLYKHYITKNIEAVLPNETN